MWPIDGISVLSWQVWPIVGITAPTKHDMTSSVAVIDVLFHASHQCHRHVNTAFRHDTSNY